MSKVISILLVVIMLAMAGTALANEATYRDAWCSANNGTAEVINDDRTRVDCVTSEYAIEFDYANKWYEAVGQSLHYGIKTGKKPGIVLILKNEKDQKYVNRLNATIQNYSLPITVWVIH